MQRNLNATHQQKSFEMLRECSLRTQNKRDLFSALDSVTAGKQEDPDKHVSEIKKQVIRFGDDDKAKEKQWVERISSEVLLPLFQKFAKTDIPEDYKLLFSSYRPIEITRSIIPRTFGSFERVTQYFILICNIIFNKYCDRVWEIHRHS